MSARLSQCAMALLETILGASVNPVVASLMQSAAIFRKTGRIFSAHFTDQLIADAAKFPSLYENYAKQQAIRAASYGDSK